MSLLKLAEMLNGDCSQLGSTFNFEYLANNPATVLSRISSFAQRS
jgi:hypothetical protein